MTEETMRILRQRWHVHPEDAHLDAQILAMSPIEKLREICGWVLGDKALAGEFLGWAEECGYEIKEKGE